MSSITISAFQIISFVLTATVLARLLWSRLFLKYRWFSAFLFFGLARYFILIPVSRKAYALMWMVTEAMLWAFYFLALYELYTLVLERFPGIRTMTGWMFAASIVAATATAIVLSYAGTGTAKAPDTLMLFLMAERGVLSALAVLVLLMTAFLTWFPVPLPRNLVWHSLLFAIYFFLKAGTLLARNLYGHEATRVVSNTVIPVVGWACLLLWAVVLSRSGEEAMTKVGHRWNQDEEDRLLGQLKDINASLGRLSR